MYGHRNVNVLLVGQNSTPTYHGRQIRINLRGSWTDIVHVVSHHVSFWQHPGSRPHDRRHATIEARMAKAVIERGWLDGNLRGVEEPDPPPLSKHEARFQEIKRKTALRAKWVSKWNRAERAIAKLDRSIKALERAAAKADTATTTKEPAS